MPGPPISAGKFSFAGGEFSPEQQVRVDLQKYPTGLKTARNVYVQKVGGIANRPGTHYRGTAKFANKKIRMLPFEFSSGQRYAIETGDDYFRFYTNGGQVAINTASAWVTLTVYAVGNFVLQGGLVYYCIVAHTAGTFATDLAAGKWVRQNIYEIPSVYAHTDLPSLRYAQSADTLFIVHPTHAPMMLQRLGATSWQLIPYPFVDGPFMIQNTDDASTVTPDAATGAVNLVAAKAIFNTLHIGALWQIRHDIEGQATSVAITGAGTQAGIACGGTWRLITHGTWTGKFQVEKSTDAGVTWTKVRAFSSTNDNNVNTFGTEVNPTGNKFLVRINATVLSAGTLNLDLTTDAFTQVGVVKITAFTNSTHVAGTVQTDLGSTAATADWAEGSWSDYRGYPRTVTFNQNRLVFASTVSEPNTEWMTQTGNFYSFFVSQPILDTDAIDSLLPSRELNEISAIVPLLGMVAFTSSGEWAVGDPGVILSPNTIAVRPNSYYGSSGVQPVVVGNRIIFVQSSGAVIRDLAYQYFYNYFDGADISIFSNHLFVNKQVVEMAYQQDPNSLVWMTQDDGTLIALTYLREQDMLAFTHCDTRDGLDAFESMCSIQGVGYKEVWFSVQRANGVRFIEQLDQRGVSTDPADQFFVDCGISYEGQSQKVITGLSHLEGKQVAILADGNVIANYLTPYTVSGGQITLPQAASKVHIGIPIVSDIETLNAEVPNPTGTTQDKKALISRVTINVVNSRGGYAGREFSDLFQLASMYPAAYNVPLPLYTGPVKDSLAGGFQDGGRVCIRQLDPLPLTIVSIIPVITVGGNPTEIGDYTAP